MRKWMGWTALAVASCTMPAPPERTAGVADAVPGQEAFLDQGWTAADRETFTNTPQGSYVMPLAWFRALRRTDQDEPFAADQLRRYGYLPRPSPLAGPVPLPVGFVQDGTAGTPQLGMTCAACHTGQVRHGGQTWRIEGGRADADFQAFLTDLGAAARATLDAPDRLAGFTAAVLGPAAAPAQARRLRQDLASWTGRYASFMEASLPDRPWGPGRLDAFGMIFNRVAGLDLGIPSNLSKADAPVRYPFIWDAPRQDRTQWTGAAPNGTYLRGLARNTGEVFGVFGRFDPVPVPVRHAIYRNSVNLPGLQALEEKVVALRPPPWPRAFGLDPVRASRGAQVFQSECAGCHGIKPSTLVSNAWRTEVRDAGTDRRAFDNSQRMASSGVLAGTQQPPLVGERLADRAPKLSILANAVVGSLGRAALLRDGGVRRAIERDLAEDRLPLQPARPGAAPAAAIAGVESAAKDSYKLRGDGQEAAYEARVLTGIWAVGPYLHNGSVPTLWELLKPAKDRMRRFAVGHRDFDPVDVGLETAPAPGRAMFVVDPSNGNGNGGHEYGTALPEQDRRALVEHLKTL